MDLNLCKVFNAIYTERSVSRAAIALCLSQPAISNSLRKLREFYEDELFVRSADGVTPTSKAQEIMISIKEALNYIEATFTDDEEFRPEISHRTFTISMTDYGEYYFLPGILKRVAEEAPDVEVICLPNPGATITLEMKSGAVDLVWDWLRIEDTNYHSKLIFEDPSCCIVRRGHPSIDGSLTLEQFMSVGHIALRATRTHIPMIERKLDSLSLERRVVSEISHITTMPGVIAKTDLIGCMPQRLAQSFARQLDLQVLPNPVLDKPVPVYQMWHRRFEKDVGHQWFRSVLRELVRQL